MGEFKKTEVEKDSISVILTGFKRDNFDLQIETINSQTIKPKNVFLYQDEEHVNLDKYRKEYGVKHIHSKDFNFGFYGRMSMALLMDTEYTLVIDDDTIPGERWLENCLQLSKEKNCIVGPGGRTVNDKTINEVFDHTDSVDAPFEESLKVDFLIHSWFFKTEWLQYMFRTKPYTLYNGEDMHLSISCKVYGDIDTYVAKQPFNDRSLWGDTNIGLGTDEHATWRKGGHGPIRGEIIKYWMENGWKPINYRNEY